MHDCSKLTAGIKISSHFCRMLLQYSNGDLQFALWYGFAMQHWRSANCSLHVALCITTPQHLCFAVCTVQVTLYIFQRIIGDFQFALCKLHVSVLHCNTDDQFGLCKLYRRQCSAAICGVSTVLCGIGVQLWRISVCTVQVIICWYCTKEPAKFNLHCPSYNMWFCSAASVTCNL